MRVSSTSAQGARMELMNSKGALPFPREGEGERVFNLGPTIQGALEHDVRG